MTVDSPWLTVKAASAYSTLSVRTINELIATQVVASHKVGGRRLLHTDDLDRYLRSCRVAPMSAAPSRRRRTA